MGADFNFNKRDFEKQVKKAVEPQMRAIAPDMEKMFADLTSSHEGEPVEQIRPSLEAAFIDKGLSAPTEPELTTYATHVSDGTRIDVRVSMKVNDRHRFLKLNM